MKNVLFCTMVLSLILGGCGGGGGGGGGDESPKSAENQNSKLGGLWFGKITYADSGYAAEVIGVSTEAGEVRFYTEGDKQGVGNFVSNGQSFSGTLTEYASNDFVYDCSGKSVVTTQVTGTIIERNQISGSSKCNGKVESTFNLSYSNKYEIGSSLKTLSGVFSDSSSSFTVDSNGTVYGQNSYGCIYNGKLSIIDEKYNVYRVNATISNCGDLNGSYSGLASMLSDQAGDALLVQVNGSYYAISSLLRR